LKKSDKFFKQKLEVLRYTNMYLPEKKNTIKGIWDYGNDNKLPNKLLKWVLDSGIGKKASEKRRTYIAADGFNDEKSSNLQVNEFQNADGLVQEISGYLSYFKGFALHVKRRGSQFEVKNLPLQDIRKRLDGSFSYNPTYSASRFEPQKEVIIAPFLGKKPINTSEFDKIKDNGELLYVYHRTADSPIYPVPDYYAGIEDIRTSAELQKFDLASVRNGFMPSAILTLIGNLDNTTKDEAGRTEQDYFDEALEHFTGNVRDAEGQTGQMRLMVMNARTKEEAPVLTPFDAKAIFDASIQKRDNIERSVCRLFGVHPVLANYSDAQVLGNTQAIANASLELNNDVLKDQQLITWAFETLYPGMDWSMTSLKPIKNIPSELYSVLTVNEKRALLGYPEINESELNGGSADDTVNN